MEKGPLVEKEGVSGSVPAFLINRMPTQREICVLRTAVDSGLIPVSFQYAFSDFGTRLNLE